jgi:hypothetical protein
MLEMIHLPLNTGLTQLAVFLAVDYVSAISQSPPDHLQYL